MSPRDRHGHRRSHHRRAGIIRPIADPALRELWPESIFLQANHCRFGYTIETPSSLPLANALPPSRRPSFAPSREPGASENARPRLAMQLGCRGVAAHARAYGVARCSRAFLQRI